MNVATKPSHRTPPSEVHKSLKKFLLADGFELVFDPAQSHGCRIIDARNGDEYLDLFSFFASQPVGFNHPKMRDRQYLARLLEAAESKPTNSDVYTSAMADFVSTFSQTLPPGFQHLFFIEGGALAVENALKAAFDWKVRKNLQAGRGELGTQIIHFRGAFHGRSGYTLSLTNSFDPRKTMYFPKFPWPRVSTPGIHFPLTGSHLDATVRAEQESLREIRDAIAKNPHDVAAIIIETIQGEGGDVHFRQEFLKELRTICDESEIILIFDEVQCGMGLTGRWWAFEHLGVAPDVFCFGKKAQVCGIAATQRFDDVESVFRVSSRINSTWGGGLVDMVRCERFLQVIMEDQLLQNAATVGAYALERIQGLTANHPSVTNVRGRGLMCAFDLPDSAVRDALRKRLMAQEKVLMLASGAKSVRFRPVLDFSRADVDTAVERIDRALRDISS